MATITEQEKAQLALADQIDQKRVAAHGRHLYCVGALEMYNEAKGLRAGVRAAVYRRGGQATGLPPYSDGFIRAGGRAVLEAGFTE